MALVARESWTPTSSVFTVHEGCAPSTPVVIGSPIRSHVPKTSVSLDSLVTDTQLRTLNSFMLNCESVSNSDENIAPSTDANQSSDENPNFLTDEEECSSNKLAKKSKNRRKKPYKSRESRKSLSRFDEFMLKMEAVDGPQLVLQLTKLEDMSAGELEANWRRR